MWIKSKQFVIKNLANMLMRFSTCCCCCCSFLLYIHFFCFPSSHVVVVHLRFFFPSYLIPIYWINEWLLLTRVASKSVDCFWVKQLIDSLFFGKEVGSFILLHASWISLAFWVSLSHNFCVWIFCLSLLSLTINLTF